MKQFETIDNIRAIKKDITGMENMLKADEAKEDKDKKIQDLAKLKEEIKTKASFLKKVTPKKLKGTKVNKAEKRIGELKKIIGKEMLSENEYYQTHPKNSDSHMKRRGFENAVEQQIKFQTDPKLKKAVNEYKALMRQLDPDDGLASNIESIRGSDSVSFFLSEQGKQNFDQINWSVAGG